MSGGLSNGREQCDKSTGKRSSMDASQLGCEVVRFELKSLTLREITAGAKACLHSTMNLNGRKFRVLQLWGIYAYTAVRCIGTA
eukprot:COSAG02_NODE_155_length_33066_cov_32.167562_1_plen_84_part_00